MAELPQVKAARQPSPGDGTAMLSRDLGGRRARVRGAHRHARLEGDRRAPGVRGLRPAERVDPPDPGLLLLVGLVLSALGALALARGMARPIRTLSDGAQRVGAGDLDQRIEVQTGDELEALADRFNPMAAS